MFFVRKFEDLNPGSRHIAGGKATNLGILTRTGFAVPEGFVILSDVLEEHMEKSGIKADISRLLDSWNRDSDIGKLSEISIGIRSRISDAPFSSDLLRIICEETGKIQSESFAIRSSSADEDGAERAWAGQLDSYLRVSPENIVEKVVACWCSLFNPRAIAYAGSKGMRIDSIPLAVIVQKMSSGTVSGVAFSSNPVTGNPDTVVIEASETAGGVVNGDVIPERYDVLKSTWEVIHSEMGKKNAGLPSEYFCKNPGRRLLEDGDIRTLAENVIAMESLFGSPCDVEWTHGPAGFEFVQCRDITALEKQKPIIS